MIFHVSIAAADPARVAGVLAELWRGKVYPFAPVATGSLIVHAGDDRNSAIEVYPRGTVLVPVDGDADATSRHDPADDGHSATHLAIATPLSQAEVMAIAEREGWIAKYRKRGGLFGVIELWLENALMVEVLTQEMVDEYLRGMTLARWDGATARGPGVSAAAK
jgi:hypothetical protein